VAILRAEGLTRRFGGLVAVNAVSLSVEAGQVHGIIGPNGAGKTTLFNLISGFVSPDSGRLWLEEHEITRLPAHERSRLGVVRTFQNIRLFRGLSVLDNVLLGQYPVARPGYLAIWPRPTARERAELARALAARPRVLLLDEPTAGMNAQESEEIADEILSIRARGITVVLVEHDMNVVMRTSDQVSVLNFGQKIAEGTPAQIQANPDVRLAYLGQEEEARAP
jgi:ABC-type branched-subunit amino acid transport system ATPase component